MKRIFWALGFCLIVFFSFSQNICAETKIEGIYDIGSLKPIDSTLRVKVGDDAPEFTLKAVSGGTVSLKDFKGKKSVVLSFIPAAWTPISSDLVASYNSVLEEFNKNEATLLCVSVDNIPTLYTWTQKMGKLWFPVVSDFWPHGDVSRKYGVLRGDGMADIVVIIIDKKGKITYIDCHNINMKLPLEDIVNELKRIQQR